MTNTRGVRSLPRINEESEAKMINYCVKRNPSNFEFVQFTGLNYDEIDRFLKSKGIFSELIANGRIRKIVFYDNFEKTTIIVGKYIVYDPMRKVLSIMSEHDFNETYETTGLGYEIK